MRRLLRAIDGPDPVEAQLIQRAEVRKNIAELDRVLAEAPLGVLRWGYDRWKKQHSVNLDRDPLGLIEDDRR